MPRFTSFAQQSLTVRGKLSLPPQAQLALTALSAASYTADPAGSLLVTLDSPAQAREVIKVMYQGLSTVGTASSRVRLTMTRLSGGGLISTDYLGFFDASYVSVVSGSTIRIGDWGNFERSDITSYHSLASMASGSVTAQTITGLSVQTGLIANSLDYLIIAGGGGGGAGGNDENGGPGGGGAGGYRTGSDIPVVTGVNYTISVGNGSPGAYAQGGDSYIASSVLIESPTGAGANTIKSYGGGYGGRDSNGQQRGASGGSGGGGGGGGWGGSYAGGTGNTPATDPSQGNNGGSSNFFGASENGAGGGGGGAGGPGENASGNNGGNGGIGAESPISGSVVRRAGGGGGRNRGGSGGTNGTGGLGGGGNAGSPGSANTGGGGGALSSGGSGVIILRYPSAFTVSSGGGLTFTTDTNVPGVKITTFVAGTGTIQFSAG